jgi:hypothetical protein
MCGESGRAISFIWLEYLKGGKDILLHVYVLRIISFNTVLVK